MTFAAVAVIGLVAARLLPLEQFPDITFPFMGVSIPYPGSTPEEIEELITRPMEDALATLPGIKEIRSRSRDRTPRSCRSASTGAPTRMPRALKCAPSSIRSARSCPQRRTASWMFMASIADQPIATVRLSADRDLSSQYEVLDRYLKKPIERIDGVARVELAGVEPREVRILVDAGRIAAHGIALERLVDLLQQSNFSVSAGQITARGERLSVRPIGELRSLDDVRQLVIDGNVRIGDVAQVELVSPQLTLRRHLNGRPAVGIDVFKSTQANIVQVVDKVIEAVDRAKSLPQMQGISIFVIDNQAEAIRQSLGDVREAGLIGGALAFIVLLLFLRHWPTTLIVSLAVPLSLLCTLAALYFFGLSINVMSMMGMMLAVGMLVDNAVVVTESVFRHRQLDPTRPLDATLAGVREVGVATLAGTATCVVVFLPILFGSRNQITIFLTHVAIPIVVAMIASLIIAQTLIPMLTARFPSPPPTAEGSWIARLQSRYTASLEWCLTHHRATAGGLVGVMLLTGGLIAASVALPDKLLRFSMFPQDAGRQVILDYRIQRHAPHRPGRSGRQYRRGVLRRSREKELGIERLYTVYEPERAHSVIVLTREGGPETRRVRRTAGRQGCPRFSSASPPSISMTRGRTRAASAFRSQANPPSASPRSPTTWCACCRA